MSTSFQFTPFHKAIEDAVLSGKNTVVNAGPGSGKTTTSKVVIAPACLVNHSKGGAFAFNTKNAYELGKALFGMNIECSTEHSAMFKCLRQINPRIRVEVTQKAGENKKTKRYQKATIDKVELIAEILFVGDNAPPKALIDPAIRLVSKMKLAGLGIPGFPAINDRNAINEIMASHAIESNAPASDDDSVDSSEQIIDCAIQLLVASNKAIGSCNYDDMIYLPLLLNAPLPAWDFLIYDEGQDAKPVTLEFFRRMHARGCQIIIVGDTHQAISHFSGSMHLALESALESLQAVSCPMPLSYRCSRVAARLACEIFPGSVIASDSANEGEEIHTTMPDILEKVDTFDNGHALLSRTHKNLMPLALRFLSSKREFMYKGIAELVTRMERMLWHASKENTALETIRVKLTEYQNHLEDTKVKANGSLPPWVPVNGETTEALCLLLAYVQGEGGTLDSVKGYLKTLACADKATNGPTLSTLHSSKGFEWPNVYLMGAMRSPLAKSEQQLHAEKCLEFVGRTRSSEDVIFVDL